MTIRVASFNLWLGGAGGGQPLARTRDILRGLDADIVGLQETGDAAARLAGDLGWECFQQDAGTAILSRFPILGHTPGRLGVHLRLPDGDALHAFNVHLPHAPYQPYQLLGIPYAAAPFLTTAEQAVAAARDARGAEVAALIAEAGALPGFVTGDFNEPSHRDWIGEGTCPLPVAWPSTRALEGSGFRDAFRSIHPDPVAEPGHTWTTTTRLDDPGDRHDRIDFVLYRGASLRAIAAETNGDACPPFPSDHRAVVCTFEKTEFADTMGGSTPRRRS